MDPCKVWTVITGLSLAIAIGLFFCLQQAPQDAVPHRKRWTPDGSHLRPLGEGDRGHPFLQNYWYRYVHDIARAQNKTNCYVCSRMPTHSQGPTIYAKTMDDSQANCAEAFGGSGFAHHSYFVNVRLSPTVGVTNYTCDPSFWVDFNTTKQNKAPPFTVHLDKDQKLFNHTHCHHRSRGGNHTTFVGETKNCREILSNGDGLKNGTYWVLGVAWLCGNNTYFVLPPSWYGICAPVFISDHTVLIRKEHVLQVSSGRIMRHISTLKPHDSVWGTNVLDEFVGTTAMDFNIKTLV
ncbi:hypothetical protein ATANTOWER_030341 [Ataeniobius toweri]|uniref:Uncharacterized protein n=1 Tax=Ataeniobius toweri TaxID=208326 RepID=A0ABU7BSQ9_9TELE|nr:hypothetical protein [Ataeniobius toweri]